MKQPLHASVTHDASATMTLDEFCDQLVQHLKYAENKTVDYATLRNWFNASALLIRDQLVERRLETKQRYEQQDLKQVYYLSLEFLVGRTLSNATLNLHLGGRVHEAFYRLGLDYEKVTEVEPDAGLGNGGLGRLAACFLDSMATLNLPSFGYGIRYEYGMFRQRIEYGAQVEHPDNWLRYGNPWEFARPDLLYPVRFNGRVVKYRDENGRTCYHWLDTSEVMAMAYDLLIPGYGGKTVNNLRLWSAKSSRDFELSYFNRGDYIQAVADKNESETLSKVLYPDDSTEGGRELRLKQQYFFVSASLQDMLVRYRSKHPQEWSALPEKMAIQLNDTHPAIAIVELMRLLLDNHQLDWPQAWGMCNRIFSYTNHTLMPEALESWPVALFERLLPRHLQIIYQINAEFLDQVRHQFPGDNDLLARLSIIDEHNGRRIRMAHLAMVGSHTANGVAELHTQLMRTTIFADFERIFPGKIINVTNGITPRRWLNHANPGLSEVISERIGRDWVCNLSRLALLRKYVDDVEFQNAFRAVKLANKVKLASVIKAELGVVVDPHSLFDIQIKRIHEYKRQLLNVLHVVTLYNRICARQCVDGVARTVIIAGKAAPAYAMAKMVIRLINDVAQMVNHDRRMGNQLRLIFIPNYDVSNAERIVPAADLSEQISTAGTEASGTGNMKLALNGALTIGTYDGANIEIMQEVGEENFFMFGLRAHEVDELRCQGYAPERYYQQHAELKQALDMIASGYFCPDEPTRYIELVRQLKQHDHFMLLADYAAYLEAQAKVEALFRNPARWTRSAILNVAGMGKFSSDRTIQEYAKNIWDVHPLIV